MTSNTSTLKETRLTRLESILDPSWVAEARRRSAAQKPCRDWQTLKFSRHEMGPKPDGSGVERIEVWENNVYEVSMRRYAHTPLSQEEGFPIGGGPWAQLGILSLDGTARHDWRDFQSIKNDLLGPEWEAVELYPAESRLVDPSNYYILYAIPYRFPFGLLHRVIANEKTALAPQRPWPPGKGPSPVAPPP